MPGLRTALLMVVAVTAVGIEYKFSEFAAAKEVSKQGQSNITQRDSRPLDLSQIKDLIPLMPDPALAGEIRNRGVVFSVDEQLVRELKQNGAGEQTLAVLNGFVGNRAPTVILRLAQTTAQPDEVIEMKADGRDPDGDSLDYYWVTNLGEIRGAGVTVKLALTGLSALPAHINVSVTVSDRKGGFGSSGGDIFARSQQADVVRPRRADDHDHPQEHELNESIAKPTVPSIEETPRKATPSMAMEVTVAGDYSVVTLSGSSKDRSNRKGTLKLTVGALSERPVNQSVQGMLSGNPCRVLLVPLENVASNSILEPPSAENDWSKIVARVVPRDRTRAMSFSIEWELGSAAIPQIDPVGAAPGVANSNVSKAVIVSQIAPEYPKDAFLARVQGLVLVSVNVNELGNVTSAKAVQGPNLLRTAAENAARACKFRPALRDGKPVPSVVVIGFDFKLQG